MDPSLLGAQKTLLIAAAAPRTALVTSIVQIQHLELYIKQEEGCREQESIKDLCPRQMQERSRKTGRRWRRPAETTMGGTSPSGTADQESKKNWKLVR